MRPELAFFILGVACVVGVIALTIAILYFLTLYRALDRVSRRNRLMEPGMVWLGLIPIFNLVWNFFLATRIPDSLRNEFDDRGLPPQGDYGRGVGVTNAVLGVIAIPFSCIGQLGANPDFNINPQVLIGVSAVNAVLGLAQLTLFILFWVKIASCSGMLLRDNRREFRDDDDFDDDDDDRRRRDPDRLPPDPGSSPESIRPDERDRYR